MFVFSILKFDVFPLGTSFDFGSSFSRRTFLRWGTSQDGIGWEMGEDGVQATCWKTEGVIGEISVQLIKKEILVSLM